MVMVVEIVHCFRVKWFAGSSAVKKQSDDENEGKRVPGDRHRAAQPDQPEYYREIANPSEHQYSILRYRKIRNIPSPKREIGSADTASTLLPTPAKIALASLSLFLAVPK
jgi:hypothetical protein